MPLLDFDTRDNIRKRQSQAFRARATQAAQRQAEARRRILAQKDAKLFRKEATALTQQVTQRRTDSQGFREDAQKLVSATQRDLSPLRTTRQLERQEYEEAPRETGVMRTRPEQFREAARAREESTATPVQQLGLEALRTSDISPLDLATSFATGAFPAEYLVSETGSAVLGGLGHAAESIGAPKGTSTAGRVIGSLAGPEMLTGAGRAGLRATGRAVARDIESRPGGLASEVGGSRVPGGGAYDDLSDAQLKTVWNGAQYLADINPTRADYRTEADALLNEIRRRDLPEEMYGGISHNEAVRQSASPRQPDTPPSRAAAVGGSRLGPDDARSAVERFSAEQPRAEGVPANASNMVQYQIKEAIKRGERIPADVFDELGPDSLSYHKWASQKSADEIVGPPYSGGSVGAAPPRTTPPGAPPRVPPVDDVPISNTPEDPIQKMTTWLNESKGALVKGRQDRRAQVATLRKQQAAALGEAYDNPNLTPREQFETGTKNMAGTAGTTGTGPPPINEEEVGSLLTKIRDFPIWQNRKFKARNAQSGLLKLMGGELPDQSELKLLEQVFGPDFVKAASSADSNAWREVGAALALPRTGRTMLDMSWLWRQGVGVHARHPEVYKNAAIGARALVDPNFARQWDEAVRMKPGIVKLVGDDGVDATWTVGELQDEVDLFLPKLEDVTGDLAERTEEFTATSGRDTWVGKMTNWAASPFSRNFIGTGNATRSSIFENTISSPFYRMGGKVTMNDARALAWLTNVATGRGDLYGANRYGALLAQPAFSPRLFAARLQHAASPAMLATGIGAPRSLKTAALAAQQLTTFIGSGIAIAAIASQVPGLRSEQNPLSSKWGKIEIGFDPLNPKKETTKVDLFGGYQQYARTIAQLYAAKAKSDSGEIYEKDRWSIFEQFARNKASPNAGMIWDVLSGEYGVGNQKVDLKTAAGIRTFLWNELSPLSFNDIVESVNRDDGFKPQYGVLAPLSTGGMGVQTYGGDTSPGATIYDIQEFKGIPADMQYDITGKEGFLDRVKKARNELVRTGTPQNKLPKMSASIIEVGEAEGLSKEVIQSALYLNSQKWQQENRTDEWYDFVIDNEEELRESNPDLFSQWLNEFLNLNRDKRVTE